MMTIARIVGIGIDVHIEVKDELDRQIVEMALDMADKREIKMIPSPKFDTPNNEEGKS
jgi:hypothetical protein